jgi:NADH dehydrogenase
MSRERVVILGAGFGGIECAKELEGGPTDVEIVDRHNYHLFTPLLYQVASSLLNPSDIAYPVRKIFAGSPNVRFRQGEVVDVSLDDRQLLCADGSAIHYDRLVVAAGSTTHFFGNDAIRDRALGLKDLGEALQLRNHILSCLEQASHEADRDVQQALMTFVIVGGGPTGVEFSGALAELMRLVLPGEYPRIGVPARILLAEGRNQLLGAFSEELGHYTEQRLDDLGVEVLLETLVEGIEDDVVVLGDGRRISSHTVVWSAGVKPSEVAALPSLPQRDRSGRVAVDGHLRVEGRPEVFAIGDVAGVEQDGAEIPMLSAPAMQQGRYVADYITSHVGQTADAAPNLPPFRYVDKGTMATIGRNAAICQVGDVKLTGWLGWVGWLVVHIYYLIGFRNRLVVLLSWAYNYIFYDRPVRIIAHEKRRSSPPH